MTAYNHLHPERWDRAIESRDVTDLLPTVRNMAVHMLTECQARRIDCMIVSTYRDHEAQAKLWNRKETYHAPGWSWHQYRCAFDIMVLRYGRPVGKENEDDLALWEVVGGCGIIAGLEWGGAFKDKDVSHFQHRFGREIEDVQRGTPFPETLNGSVNFNAKANGSGGLSPLQKTRATVAHWMMRRGEAMYYSATKSLYVRADDA